MDEFDQWPAVGTDRGRAMQLQNSLYSLHGRNAGCQDSVMPRPAAAAKLSGLQSRSVQQQSVVHLGSCTCHQRSHSIERARVIRATPSSLLRLRSGYPMR